MPDDCDGKWNKAWGKRNLIFTGIGFSKDLTESMSVMHVVWVSNTQISQQSISLHSSTRQGWKVLELKNNIYDICTHAHGSYTNTQAG